MKSHHEDLHWGILGKGRHSVCHLQGSNPKGPDVGLGVIAGRLGVHYLRRHPARRPDESIPLGFVSVHGCSDPKVSQLHFAMVSKKDVSSLGVGSVMDPSGA